MIRDDPADVPIYEPRRPPRHETIRLRDHDMHLTRWGPDADLASREGPVLLLHGFLDTAATFQFLVDEFVGERPLIGLDWRGFGRSEWSSGGYWFHDYLADLDSLIDRLCGGIPARIIGHSMGGNVAMLYAGLRADKIRSIVNLEGFGLPRSAAHQTPARIRQWLDQVKSVPIAKRYDSVDQLAAIVAFRYPRFTPVQARFVAAAWSKVAAVGVELLGDPRHRRINPVRYHREDAEACWRNITAPVFMLLGQESEYLADLGADGADAAFRECIRSVEIVRIAGAGHMLHIEQADVIAPLIERFLNDH